jgi:hypothetical protein
MLALTSTTPLVALCSLWGPTLRTERSHSPRGSNTRNLERLWCGGVERSSGKFEV